MDDIAPCRYPCESRTVRRGAAQGAIDQEPDYEDCYWNAVNVALAARNFDDVLKYLNLLEEEFQTEFLDLTTIPHYAEFVKSAQYQKWLESRE